MSNNQTTFVGVDIGWNVEPSSKSTGLCTLEGGRITDISLSTEDKEIIEYVNNRSADFVGVDAPLIVRNKDGERPVESELRSLGHSVYPANRTWFNSTYGGIRGEKLVDALEREGYDLAVDTSVKPSVIEVYPHLTILTILGNVPTYKNDRKARIYDGLKKIWYETQQSIKDIDFSEVEDIIPEEPIEVTKSDLKKIGDMIDAFYSGYVLKLDYKYQDKTEVFGNIDTGSILSAV